MNDLELDLALGAIGQQRTDVVVPAALHESVAVVPSTTTRRHSRLPSISGWPRAIWGSARFVVAAAVVALFGGFVLAGILATPEADENSPAATTPSPSPVTVDSVLSGMVVSEETPGVIVVENDGYRDVTNAPGMWNDGAIAVGRDGTVWIIWPAGRFFRLGDEVAFDLEAFYDGGDGSYDIRSFEVGPDGTLWAIAANSIVAFDPGSDEWARLEADIGGVHDIAIGADGTIWATTDAALVRFDDDGPSTYPWPPANVRDMNLDSLSVSDDGVVWLMWEKDRDWGAVVRFDHGEWRFDPLPGPVQPYVEADVSPDGILWVAGDDMYIHHSLARFDGLEWSLFGEADGVQGWGGKQGFIPQETLVAPLGGSVVVDVSRAAAFPVNECYGVARYDRDTWVELPSPECVTDADTGPDGSVWVLGLLGPRYDGLRLTVIRPDAAAVTD
jgi:hypothetical protein